MEASLSVEISINILAALVHVAALILLRRSSQHNIKGSQKYLFISLSLTELSYCLISLTHLWCKEYGVKKSIRKHITIFRRIAVLLMYYFLMIYITLERFAAIYLNIKYGVYWSPLKTKRLIFFTSFVCIAASILVSVTWFQRQWRVTTFVYIYLYPPFMIIFMICAIFTYSYIVIKVIRSKRTITRQVSGKYEKRFPWFQPKSIIVPTAIIVTFIFFMVVPNFVHMIDKTKILKLAKIVIDVTWILFPIGFIADAIIYVFSITTLRNICSRKRKVTNSNYGQTCVQQPLG